MIRKCCICQEIMGTKPPFWDMSITSGFCEPCFTIEMKKIEKGGDESNEELEGDSNRLLVSLRLEHRTVDDQHCPFVLDRKTEALDGY